ncbi:hypothetical protein AMAG_01185 [Allomyces macrogynus ATCC 38327]|uniref:Phosphatidylinositol N-acetylglucosaminyltransferase subunit C n=1 Tax=Allomyces macrogynus (strain ATCC 38327) TaxID=578462 RepID=A0A0L0RY35_ALLM3|nr:hypothetical protein, variant [Allomyces macrogynus ATCC 38327]KNE55274.1 hypothetical protein AMAG_01185 [Allomyces macrogynus ATCC 38327]|eukprot:KNE55273.1 hypothetical protein, variant [Allomyces macrogynus ATCC 38327]
MLSGRSSAGSTRSAHGQASTAKSVIILVAVVLALSPILKTLTMDISSDSIWALATLLFVGHLLLSDYRATRSAALTFPGSIGTNLAIFASVLLASRLASTMHVFSLMLLAALAFIVAPWLRRRLSVDKSRATPIMAATTITTAVLVYWPISLATIVGFLVVAVMLSFCTPAWLQHLHRFKSTLHGPWDQAVVLLDDEDVSDWGPPRPGMSTPPPLPSDLDVGSDPRPCMSE